jgi:tripartite-type tricarboxylate transporter receptor subunit TctC
VNIRIANIATFLILFFGVCVPRADALGDGCKQRFEDKRVRFIVPNSPGGGYDTYARMIAPYYAETTGTTIIVENHAGAGGLIGSNAIKNAKPDGTTMGIINAPGLMMAYLTEETNAPNPAEDYAVLARIVKSEQVWLTAGQSKITNMDDLWDTSSERPVVFGIRDVGSLSFLNTVIGSELLGLPYRIVAGYPGSRESTMAAIRGEVDLVSHTFESILDHVESGDLRPLLQTSDQPISKTAVLTGVPVLGGGEGIAAKRAVRLGRDPERAVEDASALAALIGAGRLLVAPKGLDPDLAECMKTAVSETLANSELRAAAAKAKRTLDVADSEESLADLQQAIAGGRRFLPAVREAVKKLRE